METKNNLRLNLSGLQTFNRQETVQSEIRHVAGHLKYEDLDTFRAIQLHQQPTERLKFDIETNRTNHKNSDVGLNSGRLLKVQSSGHKIIADGSESKIQETLAILESQSPFKNLGGKDPEKGLSEKICKLNLVRESTSLNHSQSENENVLDTLDIDASFVNLNKLEEKKDAGPKKSVPPLIIDPT